MYGDARGASDGMPHFINKVRLKLNAHVYAPFLLSGILILVRWLSGTKVSRLNLNQAAFAILVKFFISN